MSEMRSQESQKAVCVVRRKVTTTEEWIDTGEDADADAEEGDENEDPEPDPAREPGTRSRTRR